MRRALWLMLLCGSLAFGQGATPVVVENGSASEPSKGAACSPYSANMIQIRSEARGYYCDDITDPDNPVWRFREEMLDTDNDGLPDTALVGDWDGDGKLEIEDDIQGALDALTDTDSHHITIAAGAYKPWGTCVSGGEACTHDDPIDTSECTGSGTPAMCCTGSGTGTCGTSVPCPTGDTCCATSTDTCSFSPGGTYGLIEPPSNTLIECRPGAVLHGLPWTDATNGDAVFGILGVDNVTVTGCEIDGGMCEAGDSGCPTSGYVGGIGDCTGICALARMGFYLRSGNTNIHVTNNYIHDTHHAALYAKDSVGVWFEGNRLEYVGNHPAQGGSPFNCVYLYDEDAGATSDIHVLDNECRYTGGSGYNTRADVDGTDFVSSVIFDGNIARDTGLSGFSLSGARHVVLSDNVSFDAGENGLIFIQPDAMGDQYDIIVNGFMSFDATLNGLYIQQSNDRIDLHDIRIVTPTRSCVLADGPMGSLVMDGLDLYECGRYGVALDSTSGGFGSSYITRHATIIRNLTVDGTDAVDRTDATYYPGLYIGGPSQYITLEGHRYSGFTDKAIWFGTSGFNDVKMSDIDVDAIPPQYVGDSDGLTLAEMEALDCTSAEAGNWVWITDASGTSDCSTGSAGTDNWCMCDGTDWDNDFNPPTTHGNIHASSSIVDAYISDVVFHNQKGKQSFTTSAALVDTILTGFHLSSTHPAMAAMTDQDIFSINSPVDVQITNYFCDDLSASSGGDCITFAGSTPVRTHIEYTNDTSPATGACDGLNGSLATMNNGASSGLYVCENGTWSAKK